MIKYLKYTISPITMLIAIYAISLGAFGPTFFIIGYSLFMILGDIFLGKDTSVNKYSYPFVLDIILYINLPLLLLLVLTVVLSFRITNPENWLLSFYNNYLYLDINYIRNSIHIIDKIALIEITGLFIGIMGTVPGHELTHRKKRKFDMFIGNWLLGISWDCAFAIEHVYGHHKNVCLPNDPATAKRGENVHGFIFRAIIKEQKDAWKIELKHLKRRGYSYFGIHNKMLIGYLRSLFLTIGFYYLTGIWGMFLYLLLAVYGKVMLEAVNFTEHYGLVRQQGKPVFPRHSWNSNSVLSSIYLYNLPRHSSHHEKSNLEFWELKVYKDAPTMPYGYLSMVYLVLFLPSIYHKIMAKELIKWDQIYATEQEKSMASIQNKNSGIPILENHIYSK